MLKALIFDFDGTIAETERDGHRTAYNAAFADLGLSWTWDVDLYGELLSVAGGKERVLHYIAAYLPERPAGAASELAAEIHARKAVRFAELAPNIELRPGVSRLVAEAKACGLQIAIATTASVLGVRAVLLKYPETLAAFDVIAAGDVVPRKKPAPDIYEYALAELGVSAFEAVAFEDSAIGVAASAAAGIATVVTPSIYTANESFDRAGLVLDSLAARPNGMPVTIAFLRTLVRDS